MASSKWDEETCFAARKNFKYEVLKWCQENGCPDYCRSFYLLNYGDDLQYDDGADEDEDEDDHDDDDDDDEEASQSIFENLGIDPIVLMWLRQKDA